MTEEQLRAVMDADTGNLESIWDIYVEVLGQWEETKWTISSRRS